VIRIPVYLAVAQWALLGALGLLVVIMFRQLGHVLAGDGRKDGLGPVAGSTAAPLTYVRPGAPSAERLRPGDGQPLLLAFVDPTCPSCEQLVAVLDHLHDAGELAAVRLLLLISDPPSYLEISDTFRSTRIEIGRPAGDGLASYRASATPLLVAVDGAGVVQAAGSVIRAAEVRAFVQACLLPAPEQVLAVVPAPPGGVHDLAAGERYNGKGVEP